MSHPDSTHEVAQVPDEAVAVLAEREAKRSGWTDLEDAETATDELSGKTIAQEFREQARDDLTAALPSLTAEITKGLLERLRAESKRLHDEAGALYKEHADATAGEKQGRANALRVAFEFLRATLDQPPVGDEEAVEQDQPECEQCGFARPDLEWAGGDEGGMVCGSCRANGRDLAALMAAVEPFTVDGGVGCGTKEIDRLVETYEQIVGGGFEPQQDQEDPDAR